jgi:glycosyltransferase involved in cell wall biosynthesis
MRVLHVLNELKPSGAEVMLQRAAPVWTALGWQLLIVSLTDSPGAFEGPLAEAGWRITRIQSSQRLVPLVRSFARSLTELQPDVVHFHQERLFLPLALTAQRAGIPIVRSIHNNFPFQGLLRVRKTLERAICRAAGCDFIAISTSVRDNERRRFLNPTELCWNWFDSTAFRPPSADEKREARQRLGIPASRVALVSVGNGSDVKNYKAVIKSLGLLHDRTLHYYQVGNPHPLGTDAFAARDAGVEDQVTFVGAQSNITDWLWACDIFVMPSIFEGYGLAAIEALASGCDCILADCPGLSDFRELKFRATWVSPDAPGFSAAIAGPRLGPAGGEVLAQNTRLAHELFNTQRRATAYAGVWQRKTRAHAPAPR